MFTVVKLFRKMATSLINTSSKIDQKHQRKKMKSNPKSETGKIGESEMEYKGKWKVANVDYSALKLDELREFMGIEELSVDHEIVKSKHTSRPRSRKRRRKTSQHRQMGDKQTEEPSEDHQASPPKKKKHQKKPTSQNPSKTRKAQQEHEETTESGKEEPEKKDVKVAMDTKKKNEDAVKTEKKNLKSAKATSFTKGVPVPKKDSSVNLPAWKNLYVPAPILNALHDLGYNEPTPIQKECIPAAIKDGKDIVGAAETGSGKTLAFGIPVLHNILHHQAVLQREARSKAFKQANAPPTGPQDPSSSTTKVTASSPKKEQLTVKQSRSNVNPSGLEQKKMKSKTNENVLAGQGLKGKSKKDSRKGGLDEEHETRKMEDDESDEDIEYDFDDDEDIEYDFDDDEDEDDLNDDSEDEDLDFDDFDDNDSDDELGEGLEDFAEAKNDEDSSEEDEEEEDDDDEDDDDEKNQKKSKNIKKSEKTEEKDEPADKPPKRPRAKKGQRKRKFRIHERKVLELDGAEFEGVELINKMDKRGFGCVRAIDDISDAELLTQVGLGEMVQQIEDAQDGSHDDRQLYAMILTPTRELAVQVKNHLVAVAKYTDIKIAVIVGGMSAQKQERVLKKRPEIVVGTPGRIWELFREGEPHLSTMSGVRCLVLDEADRMIEKGHYEQLTEILRHMNHSPASLQRQTFVFSATLTLVHLGSERRNLANKPKKNTPKQEKKDRKDKLNALVRKVGIRDDPTVVDLTQKQGTVASLMEAKIICDVTDKDIYLYYFLLQFPGRTLVFCNSIDCIRRLCSILTLLACNPLPLHSSMHQKQRLKNLDRFASNPKALLLATDVAARGLDIPDVQHVIHYQVPRTSETYIHRSGRTARQAKEGISILLVAPTEAHFFKRVCKTLKRDDIPSFPVDHMYYNAVKERVDLARHIDQTSHRVEKKKHTNDWFIKAAKELDVDLDEDMVLHDLGDAREQGQYERKLQHMKGDLKSLLKRTVFPRGSSWLYPTAAGKLASPLTQGSGNALSVVKQKFSKRKQDGGQVHKEPVKKVKKSKNKFKRADETI